MTRETKVGLLIGLGVILLIGIIVSDHLSVVQQQDPAEMTTFADQAQESIHQPRPVRTAGQDDLHAAAPAAGPAISGLRSTEPVIVEPLPAPGVTPQVVPGTSPSGAPGAIPGAVPGVEARQPILTPGELDANQIVDEFELTRTHPPIAGIFANADRNLPEAPDEVVEPGPGSVALPAAPRTLVLDGSGPEFEQPVQLPEPPARRPGSELIHYVKSGENLYTIAETYYGNGEYWRSIAKQNPDTVGDEGQVTVGARLVIPNRSGLIDSGQFTAVTAEHVVGLTEATTPPPTRTPGKTVTVRSGDTLSGLAANHLGSEGLWRQIFEANRDKLDRPEDLRAGMDLKIPARDSGDAPRVVQLAQRPTPPPAARSQVAAAEKKTYTVKPGDNLTKIAEKALGDGDRWKDLFEANRDKLASADDVKVGQTLVLP